MANSPAEAGATQKFFWKSHRLSQVEWVKISLTPLIERVLALRPEAILHYKETIGEFTKKAADGVKLRISVLFVLLVVRKDKNIYSLSYS